jgi:S1-C subfamily serine protease
VVRVDPGSGAERSGIRGFTQDRRGRIQLGDVIVAVDGEPVKGSGDLLLALERRQPGDTVKLELLRGGRRRALEVELDAARGGR